MNIKKFRVSEIAITGKGSADLSRAFLAMSVAYFNELDTLRGPAVILVKMILFASTMPIVEKVIK